MRKTVCPIPITTPLAGAGPLAPHFVLATGNCPLLRLGKQVDSPVLFKELLRRTIRGAMDAERVQELLRQLTEIVHSIDKEISELKVSTAALTASSQLR